MLDNIGQLYNLLNCDWEDGLTSLQLGDDYDASLNITLLAVVHATEQQGLI